MSAHGKKGTGTFIQQRVTAFLNIFLVGFLIWLVVSLAGADRATMAATFSNPFVFVLTLVLFASVLVHMRIGMGEVIEDYIHTPSMHKLCMGLNTAFAVIVGAIGVLSVLVLAFGG
ncbi:succinate dehydrogenase, hydrophobic membrane anchor protein [Pelagibacterium xiamenense]|uniref:succinate dehydrogenase, hydrophobic membrane anchor protein n=1 Tax=Pelagibacterium xiamenense TaxID=2901140 RepID=UPI001E2B82FC|nr:succinate dehydrogenase, hydrophobic membrane anchor protein [Pelagibacterium xiamenense]MCD7058279.1 succinate dehydrogenase, hydrophobic membrane anchor protein [Pelagibacterium xiamenense]